MKNKKIQLSNVSLMFLKILNILLLSAFVFAVPLKAQMGGAMTPGAQAQQQTFTVAGISVEGNEFSNAETIITLSGLRTGAAINFPFDPKIQNAIKNIWERKQFSDVDIVVDNITSAGVFLEIQVDEYPRANKVMIENNEEIDDYDLIQEVGKVSGDIISDYDLYLIEKRVEALYAEEGLSFAQADASLEKTDSAAYKNIIVYVEEGIEFDVNSITFEGNDKIDDGDLKGSLEETNEKSWWRFWRSAKFDKEEYEKDIQNIVKYYNSEGFIDAEIIKDSVVYNEEDEEVDIKLKVREGQRIYVRNITFDGNTVYPDYMLKTRLGFDKGDPYDTEKFQKNLLGNPKSTDASSLYLDNGYLQAQLMPQENRVAPDTVDIEVKVYENDRFTINRVEISGNEKTYDRVIRRELYTRPGDYFDRSAIIRSVRALGVLQYFNPETLKPDVQPAENDQTAVNITYNVEERSTDTFNASLGFAGSFGLTGAVGFTFNNFSISEPIKGGAGQVFNFNWEFGQANRYRTFTVGFTEPWFLNKPITIGFNLFDTYYNFSTLNQQRTGASVNIGKRFKWPDDYWRGDWSLRYMWNDNKNQSIYYRKGRYSEITVGQTFSRTSFNNQFFPSRGSKFSLATNFAMGALGVGETDYLKNELTFEMYNPLMKIGNSDKLVFAILSEVGYLAGMESDTTISQIELYRMGGNGLGGFNVTPLRGYEDNRVGPSSGGKLQAKYAAELRFALSLDPMPIFLYGFAEAGNVWSDIDQADIFDLKRSSGIGIQMMVNPIGIIGFSYGYGFDPARGETDESGWQFLFHLGQKR